MAKKKSLFFAIIPLVYLIVIGFFLYLQFFSARSFSERIGSIEVTGLRAPKTFWQDSDIRKIEVRYHGIVFSFSDSKPLYIRSEGKRVRLEIKSYDLYANSIVLILDRGSIGFGLGGNFGERMSVKFDLPGDELSLWLPFDASAGHIETGREIPHFLFQNEIGEFYFTLPENSRINFTADYFHLDVPAVNELSEIIITEADPELDNLYLYWFSISGVLKNNEEYRERLGAYLDKAYRGWNGERYVNGQGLWRIKGGEAAYSEKLGVAWLAESLSRGDYRQATAFFQAAILMRLANNPDQEIQYLASPYVGDLDKFRAIYLKRRKRGSPESKI